MDEEDSIAIVGVGCIFPGAENLEAFWRVLENGEDHVQDIPKEKFNVDAFYDEDPDAPGKTYIRKAGFVTGLHQWDNKFFGIGQNEAKQMDPQQRLVLECVYMAMEDGGITTKHVNRSETGVYIGAMNSEFETVSAVDISMMSNYSVTGSSRSIISAAVAYHLNLHGPAITLDTACSSSLVAIHMAAQAIKSGEITMAICGGVNVLLNPSMFVALAKARMASPTGKCHTFSKNADGYARGEGCGIIILKKLGDAKRDNNKIWGTVATGCNQDGHENSPITAPSGPQQVKLLEKIYSNAGISPKLVQYIEAHGTGTPVGDPIEVNALGSYFGQKSVKSKKMIGSVKTNIGHLESGAGIAGLIKILLMMREGKFVPSLHSTELNEDIPFERYGFNVCQKVEQWSPDDQGTRVACVNCFGFGGTNSHAILFCNPITNSIQGGCNNISESVAFPSKIFFVVSGATRDSFRKNTMNLSQNLNSISNLDDLSYTSVFRRDHFKYRQLITAKNKADLEMQLRNLAERKNLFHNLTFKPPSIIFVFCGVGTAWSGMCKEMIDKNTQFRQCILKIDNCLLTLGANISVMELFQTEKDITRDSIENHIAIFACQVALSASWKYIGICPTAILGQSVGEVAAACECGALTLEDAVKVIYHRSRALAICKGGNMIVVRNCPVENVEKCCRDLVGHKANIAVYNSNESCTVSGDPSALTDLKELLPQDAQFIPLQTDCAYHSPHTVCAGKEIIKSLGKLNLKSPHVQIFSTVTGDEMVGQTFGSVSYWAENITKPVLFKQAVESVRNKHSNVVFLEIGPRPVLRVHLSNIFDNSDEVALPSINKGSEVPTFMTTLGLLFERGITPVWEKLTLNKGNLCSYPEYIFSKNDCSLQSEKIRKWTQENTLDSDAGRIVKKVPGESNSFSIEISESNTPFVFEHIVENRFLIPGALFGEIGLEIARHIYEEDDEIEIGWIIQSPLEVSLSEQKTLIIHANSISNRETRFTVKEIKDGRVLANGSILKKNTPDQPNLFNVSDIGPSLGKRKVSFDIYKYLSGLGFNHGPMFRIVTNFEVEMNEGLAEMTLPVSILRDLHRACLHPVIIDGMFQACTNPNIAQKFHRNTRILPVKVKSLVLKQPPTRKMTCYAKIMMQDHSKLVSNAILLKENGSLIAEMKGFEMHIISDETDHQKQFYEETWKEVDISKFCIATHKIKILSWDERKISNMHEILSDGRDNIEDVNLSSCSEREQFIRTAKRCEDITLLFVPGIPPMSEDIPVEVVFENIKQNAHFFLQILQTMNLTKARIFILTEWVQNCVNSAPTGVLGSELWGMARSFLKEKPSANVVLCDLHGAIQSFQHQIQRILSNFENDIHSEFPKEYVVSNTGVFTNTFQRLPDPYFERSCRIETMNDRKNISIRTSNSLNEPPFFAVPNLLRSIYTKDKYDISIENALLCSRRLLFFPQTVIPVQQHWEENIDAGHEVLCCEFAGLIRKGYKEIEVVGCCLKSVTANVLVERSCVCLKSDIRNYKLGVLSTTTIAMEFAEQIDERSSVMVIYDLKYKHISDQLCKMLKQKLCKFDGAEFDSSKDIQHPTATVLVILSEHVVCSFNVIVHWFPKLQHLLSIRGLLPFSAFALHPTRDKTIKTSIIDLYKVFQVRKMQDMFFKVRRWLSDVKNSPCQTFDDLQDSVLNLSALKSTIILKVPRQMLIRHDSAYVVVGGLSGLGWEIIKFLASLNAKIVISLSRRTPSELEKSRLKNLELLRNTEIWHIMADITNRKSLENVFLRLDINLAGTPIRGIFHGAGVLQDAPVEKLTLEMFDKPLFPKIIGTLNLHHVTKHLDLDYFVLHSSIASILGNSSQTNYAAGNSFLDAFAHYRRSIGKSAQVINWGLLDVGMGADQNIQSINALNGMLPLRKDQIVSALVHILLINVAQVMVADMDFSRERKFEAPGNSQASNKAKENHSEGNILRNDCQSNDELLKIWIRFVITSAASVLSIENGEIKESSILLDFGLDSQKAIELVNYLFLHSQIRLPVIYLMTGKSTVRSIAEYFLSKISHATDESKDSYISCSPSFMELHYFDLLEENENNTHLVIKVDLTIDGNLNDAKIWKIAALNLILMNPELRTIFKPTEHGKKRNNKLRYVLDIEDIDLHFENVKTKEDLEKSSAKLNKFRPNEDIPVRFVYWQSANFGCLRLIFSHCSIDNGCVSILAKDLETVVKHTILKQTIPLSMIRRPFDPALVMEQTLNEEIENLQSYWAAELQYCNENQSLAKVQKPMVQKALGNHMVLSKTCNEKMVRELEHYASEKKITLFSLLCTAYQITICKFLHSRKVCLISAADMRMHYPELLERAVLCVNYIPLISPDLTLNRSIHDIAVENHSKIAVNISKSSFPFKLLKHMPECKKSIHLKHQIVMEDLTLWNQFNFSSIKLWKFDVEQDTTYETCLSIVIHSKTNIELRLQISTENVGEYLGENILEALENLLHMILSKSELCIRDLKSTCSIEQEIESLQSAMFFIIDEKRHRKKRVVSLSHEPVFALEWGRKRKTRLFVTDIRHIQSFQFQDLFGISLSTTGLNVKLALENRRARDAWMAVISRKMSESGFRDSVNTKL